MARIATLLAGAAFVASAPLLAGAAAAQTASPLATADAPCVEALPSQLWGGEGVATDDTVRQRLSEAGFQDVEILQEAYLVATTAPTGGCALTIVEATSFNEVGAAREALGSAASAIPRQPEGQPEEDGVEVVNEPTPEQAETVREQLQQPEAQTAEEGEQAGQAAGGEQADAGGQAGEGGQADEGRQAAAATEAEEGARPGRQITVRTPDGDWIIREVEDAQAEDATEPEARREADMAEMTERLGEGGHGDAHIIEAAYVVRATAPNGNTVMMIVNAGDVGRAAE